LLAAVWYKYACGSGTTNVLAAAWYRYACGSINAAAGLAGG
jgi:hypothetical protein